MRREPKVNRSRRMTLLSGLRRTATRAGATRITLERAAHSSLRRGTSLQASSPRYPRSDYDWVARSARAPTRSCALLPCNPTLRPRRRPRRTRGCPAALNAPGPRAARWVAPVGPVGAARRTRMWGPHGVRHFVLRSALRAAGFGYDWVLLDCPP